MKDISKLYPGKQEIPVDSVMDAPPLAVDVSADIVDPFNDTAILDLGTEGGEITELVEPSGSEVINSNLSVVNAELATQVRIGDTVVIDINGVEVTRTVLDINTVDGSVTFNSTDAAEALADSQAIAAVLPPGTISMTVEAEVSVFNGNVVGDVTGDVVGDVTGTATNAEHVIRYVNDTDTVGTATRVVYLNETAYEALIDGGLTQPNSLYLIREDE